MKTVVEYDLYGGGPWRGCGRMLFNSQPPGLGLHLKRVLRAQVLGYETDLVYADLQVHIMELNEVREQRVFMGEVSSSASDLHVTSAVHGGLVDDRKAIMGRMKELFDSPLRLTPRRALAGDSLLRVSERFVTPDSFVIETPKSTGRTG